MQFRGSFVPVPQDALRLALLECRDAEAALRRVPQDAEEQRLSAFSSVFASFDQVLRMLASEKERQLKASGSDSTAEIALLFTIQKFAKQRRVVERSAFLFHAYADARHGATRPNTNNLLML